MENNNNNNTLVCGIYTRVSTERQAEEGYSLDEQKELLFKRAEKAGYKIYDCYCDSGISAKNIRDRPQMLRLLDDVKQGKVNVVMAWKLSRTFRNLREQLEAIEIMKEKNAIFDMVSEGIIDPNSVTGKLHSSILGMINECERETISDNVYTMMAARARLGENNGGPSPYGYDREYELTSKRRTSKLVINEKEAEVVRRVFHMFVEERHGYKYIVNVLNYEGLKTKNGNPFSISTVKSLIMNPVYAGLVRWGGHRKWAEQRRKGAVEPIISQGKHEAIISLELYKRAEAIRLAKGGKAERKYDCLNVLTGILKCPECGAGMVLSRGGGKGKKISYYSCGVFHNKGSAVCHSNSVPLEQVNSVVLDKISEICNDELIIRGVLRKLNHSRSNKIDGSEIDRVDVQKQLDKVRRDILYLQQRFEEDSCDMDVSEYKRRIRELRSQEEVFTIRLSQLQADISQYQTEKVYTIEELREVFKSIKSILERADVVELRTLLHLMIEKITINSVTREPDDITIKFNPVLTNYLGINFEEEANKASSFCYAYKKELVFTLSL